MADLEGEFLADLLVGEGGQVVVPDEGVGQGGLAHALHIVDILIFLHIDSLYVFYVFFIYSYHIYSGHILNMLQRKTGTFGSN